MRIVDLQVIPFWVSRRPFRNGEILPETRVVQTVTKILTDEGAEGYYFGGSGHGDQDGLTAGERNTLEGRIKSLVLGQDPYDREKFWHWMWVANIPENLISVLDMSLWDLQARTAGMPVHKLLGGLRDTIPAYASTLTLETLPEYLALAEDCITRGYKAIKLHAWGRLADDLELCRELRRTVGDDIHLMYDASGLFGYEDAVRFGRALEELDYYWYEEPIDEFSITALARITRELDVPIVVAETSHGGPSNALDHLMAGAGDIILTDPLMPFKGGITGSMKTAWICEAFGVMCEVHGSPVPCLHVACAIPSCRYFEQIVPPEGYFFAPGIDVASKYVDSDGCVSPWPEPGLGLRIDWPWVEKHTVRILE